MKLNVLRIKLLLSEKQLTIVDLAKRAQKSPQLVGAIIRRGTCSFKNAGILAIALDVQVSDIIDESS